MRWALSKHVHQDEKEEYFRTLLVYDSFDKFNEENSPDPIALGFKLWLNDWYDDDDEVREGEKDGITNWDQAIGLWELQQQCTPIITKSGDATDADGIPQQLSDFLAERMFFYFLLFF
jgi:hypothetical protein